MILSILNRIQLPYREDIQNLDKRFGPRSTPYYVTLKGRSFYIIRTDEYYADERKYGLANDSLRVLLEPVYDKIFNPNLVISNCFEIERNSKIGLINYVTGEILQPQFDYILPSANEPNGIAYGLKNGRWYEIDNTQISLPEATNFDPIPILKTLSFSARNIGENVMFNSYYSEESEDNWDAHEIAMIPSFAEHLELTQNVENRYDSDGEVGFNFHSVRKVSNSIYAFFVSVYEKGLNVRAYMVGEAENLVVYNSENKTFNNTGLGWFDDTLPAPAYYHCYQPVECKFLNDSILQCIENQPFDSETVYTFYKINDNGNINRLNSSRYYDFTKYTYIDEGYFEGCFTGFIDNSEEDAEVNFWTREHLTIEDLDIMRNEIFAEYGYKFKTKKWQTYFSQMDWYDPRFENVDDQLTDIDRHNIKVILGMRKKMEGKEAEYTNLTYELI
ncbi:MAG: YARHG domain-containing protein [Ekhidna sp.]|nr:YARHG domain-containing protein [Ekhidna sp.]